MGSTFKASLVDLDRDFALAADQRRIHSRHHDNRERQESGDQEPGADTGCKQPSDRFLDDHAVDDHQDRGRDQHPEQRARSHDPEREAVIIAEPRHLRIGELGEHRGGGHRNACHRGKHRVRHHGRYSEPALQAAHQRFRRVEQVARRPRLCGE
jgi:hypothetical protein